MPRKPKRPCLYPGCPNLSDEPYCEIHRGEAGRSYDQYRRRPGAAKRYGRNWRKVRAAYIEAHPLCEECLRHGKLVPVDEVHHIVPTKRGGTDSFSNLMSLCRSCHQKIEISIGSR